MTIDTYDNKINNDVIVQETMPSPMKLELKAIKTWTLAMIAIFVLAELVIFFAFVNDTFLITWTLLCGILLILCMNAVLLLLTVVTCLRYPGIRLKYSVFADKIVVRNENSDACIFDFPISEISCIESKYNRSFYFSGKYISGGNFSFCDLPCLLISSNKDVFKQRIPIGYTKETRDKLRVLLCK